MRKTPLYSRSARAGPAPAVKRADDPAPDAGVAPSAQPPRAHWRGWLARAAVSPRVTWSAWLLLLALLGGVWWQQSARAPSR